MNSLQILSFVGFTLLVAIITWWKVRKTDTGSQQGYFLAGRSLKAPVIAASLMLTNLSTEQLVGLSGQAYKSGMSVMGWEVTSAVTLDLPRANLFTALSEARHCHHPRFSGGTL